MRGLRVPLIDLDRALDGDDFAGRSARALEVLGLPHRAIHGQKLPRAHFLAGAQLHVHVVALAEQHLVLARPDELAPRVLVRVVDVALVAQEHRLRRHVPGARTAGTAERALTRQPVQRREGRALLAARRPHADLVARVDPVRILDLRVIGPDLRPVPRVIVVRAAQVPQRVATTHRVDLRHGDRLAADDGARVLPSVDRAATRRRPGSGRSCRRPCWYR